MATGDKLVSLDGLKAAYDNLRAEDAAVMGLSHAIQFVEPERTASARQSGMDYSREGNRITLNGSVSRWVAIRLYGEASSGTSSYNFATGNPGCVTLTPGRTYAVAARQIGGTVNAGGSVGVNIRLAGADTLIETVWPSIQLRPWAGSAKSGYQEFRVPDNATSTTVGLFAALGTQTTCANAVFEIAVLDVTDYNPLNSEAIAPGESVIAKANRAVGDLIMLGGELFKVTTAIAAGETITTSAITATSIAAELAALNN